MVTLGASPGMRIDAILCADQPIGNYIITVDAPSKYSFPALHDSFQTEGLSPCLPVSHSLIYFRLFLFPPF